MKTKLPVFLVFAFAFVFVIGLPAQDHAELRVNLRVESRCKIDVDSQAVSFTRVEPDVVRSISQNEPSIEVTVKLIVTPGEKVYLRIQSAEELIAAEGQTIEVSHIRWRASGEGFVDGLLNPSDSQVLGSWDRSGIWTGRITFFLDNDLSFPPGVYRLQVNLSVGSF